MINIAGGQNIHPSLLRPARSGSRGPGLTAVITDAAGAVAGDLPEAVDDEGDEFFAGPRLDLLEPAERAREADAEQRREHDLRPQLGTVEALRGHVGDEGAEQAPVQAVDGGVAHLR